jgi:hypothetical protein
MVKIKPYLVLPGMLVTCSCYEEEAELIEHTLEQLGNIMKTVMTLDEFHLAINNFAKLVGEENDIKLYAYEHQVGGVSYTQGDNIIINLCNYDDNILIVDYTFFLNKTGKAINFLRSGDLAPYMLPDNCAVSFWSGGRLVYKLD